MSSRAYFLLSAVSLLLATTAHGALTQVSNAGCSHAGNLVTNGSFESSAVPGGGPGIGQSNWRLWATGTTVGGWPFEVPAGWTSSGNANSYAVWGNDTQPTLRFSAVIPDGQFAMYFGNGASATVDLAPTFNLDGSVTFAGTPTITQPQAYPTAVTLSQTIPTAANPAPQYCMSFWVSGEGAFFASDPTGDSIGIMGFQMTNVLPGDPVLFLAVPSASDNFLGSWVRYEFLFSPINPNVDVGVEFINYGHFDLTPWGRGGTTELVLDDVMINAIPEPAGLSAIALLAILWVRRRR